MTNGNSKLLLGLLIGASVGAAFGYLAASDKKEQLIDELNDAVNKVKEGVNSAIAKYKDLKATTKEEIETVSDPIV